MEALGCFFLALLLLTVPLKLLAASFLAVMVHEMCHIAAVKLLGGSVNGFFLTTGGAVLEIAGLNGPREAIAAVAGPMGSFLLLAFLRVCPVPALCGFAQGCFNLLPIYPLDGGRILVCLLEHFVGCAMAEQIGKVVTWGTLAALCGVFLFLRMPAALVFLIPLIPRNIPCKPGKLRVQ